MNHASPLGPRLETERLLLRPPVASDFDRWAEFCADPIVTKHLGGVQPRALAWRTMATMTGAWSLRGYSMFSVIEKRTGLWIGRLGPWFPEGWPGTEVGWGLMRSAWGQGYAQEGSAAAIDWALDHLGWTEVIHTIGPGNVESQKVAERLGSRLLGPGNLPAPFDHLPVQLWGQDKKAWQSRRTTP